LFQFHDVTRQDINFNGLSEQEEVMKSNKKFLVAAVAGALAAATAVPALALENEIHGAFTSYYDLSNYTAVGNDGFGHLDAKGNAIAPNATGLAKNAPTENYFVQRVRLNYNAKVSDEVKLVTKFELDYSFWGNSAYTTGRNSGGALGADSVQIETKNLYLDLNYPQVNAKIGMQPYNDSFKGVLFDADMAGILLSHSYSHADVTAGFFRFRDGGSAQAFDKDNNGNLVADNATLGHFSNDMYVLDGKYHFSKEFAVGGAYYYIAENPNNAATTGNQSKVHTFGINAEGVLGPVNLDGFVMKQVGDLRAGKDASGWAANVGAKMKVFGGTARSQFLYVSGGHNAFFVPTSQAGSEGAALYDSELIMLHRDKNAKTIDTAIVYDVNNFDQGVYLGSAGFDYDFTQKLSASANIGCIAAANNNGSVATGTSNYYGTELNLESNYKLSPNLTVGIRGGYVFLGDYFHGLNADNPWDARLIANLAF